MKPTGVIKSIALTEPVAVRSVVIAAFGVLGMILNHTFETGTVQSVVDFVLAGFSLLHIVFTRPKVTPNAKVLQASGSPAVYGQSSDTAHVDTSIPEGQ